MQEYGFVRENVLLGAVPRGANVVIVEISEVGILPSYLVGRTNFLVPRSRDTYAHYEMQTCRQPRTQVCALSLFFFESRIFTIRLVT